MDRAVHRAGRVLAAMLVIAGVTMVARGTPVDPSTMTAPHPEVQPTLAGFRQDVWLIYSSSAAIGPDGRGQTVAHDIGTWVLPEEVRHRLGDRAANGEEAALEEPLRRLTLVAFYWAKQFGLRHQRALWLQAQQVAPATDVQSSTVRIDALESRLQHDYAPTETLEALTADINELTLAYDRERQRLVGLGPDVNVPMFERSDDLPCTRVVAQELPVSSPHGLRLLWSPAVMDFYPLTARRDHLTGRVQLKIWADDTGCLRHIEVERSSGAPELDSAALELAAREEFAPAVQDGKPVETIAHLPIVFKLDDTPSALMPAVPPFSLAAPTPAEHIRSGNDHLNSAEYDRAIAEFDLAIAAEPTSALAYADRGLAHLWKQESNQAQDDFASALRLAPNSAVALRGRGVLEYFSGDCESALTDLTRSLEYDPRSGFALRWRADVDSCLSQDSDALADLTTAEKVAPKDFAAYRQRARVLRALGRPQEALAEIDAMLAVSHDSTAELMAGAIYEEAGQPAAAAAALDLGVSLAPTDTSYVLRAEYRLPADLRGQREDYEAALRINPSSSGALWGLIRTSVIAGIDSPESLSAIAASHADDTMTLLRRGIGEWQRGERSAAEQDFRSSIQGARTNEFNHVCYLLAVADAALDRALEACNRALGFMPHLASFLDSRALVYLRLGRLNEALSDFDLSLKFRPHFAHSLYGRGIVMARLGRSSEADADHAAALRLDATIAEYFHTIRVDR